MKKDHRLAGEDGSFDWLPRQLVGALSRNYESGEGERRGSKGSGSISRASSIESSPSRQVRKIHDSVFCQ